MDVEEAPGDGAVICTWRRQAAPCRKAVVDGAVVASAPTLPQLLQAVEQQGVQRPFVTQIPAGQVTWMTTYARPLV